MCSLVMAHLRAIILPKPLRIMANVRIKQENLHKTTQLDGEHIKKQRSEEPLTANRILSNI